MSGLNKTPFMQLWTGDFLGDTLHLSAEEVGQYLLLMMAMWRNGGYLPSNPTQLARIARSTISDAVMAFFDTDDAGIYQKRLLDELIRAKAKSNIRKEAGKRGGKAKALKDKEPPLAIATVLPCHSSESESERINTPKPPRGPTAPACPLFEEFWKEFPRKVGKGDARKAWRHALRTAKPEDVIAGAKRYAAGKPDPQFTKHPGPWLRAERWLDEDARRAANGTHTATPWKPFAPEKEAPKPRSPEEQARIDAQVSGLLKAKRM